MGKNEFNILEIPAVKACTLKLICVMELRIAAIAEHNGNGTQHTMKKRMKNQKSLALWIFS